MTITSLCLRVLSISTSKCLVGFQNIILDTIILLWVLEIFKFCLQFCIQINSNMVYTLFLTQHYILKTPEVVSVESDN